VGFHTLFFQETTMVYTTSRTNLSREQHTLRAAAAGVPLALLGIVGGVFMKDVVLAMQVIRSDAAAAVVWTLWAVPVIMLTGSVTMSLLAAWRSAPVHRRSAATPARRPSMPNPLTGTAAIS
jgi:hypothetical protein